VYIRPLDVFDDEDLRAFHAVNAAAASYARDYPTEWQLPEMTASLRRHNADVELEPSVAVADDCVVGASLFEIPRMDNPHLTFLEVAVTPPARGRGVGSALVEQAVRRTGELGRRSVVADIDVPLGADLGHPHCRFAARHGFTRRLVELHQVMDYPAPAELLARLAEHSAARCGDYQLIGWGDRCPEEYVAQFCALLAAMGDQAPSGELDLGTERWDAERLRDTESRRLEQGRSSYTTAAVAPNGSLAGYTQLAVPAHDPRQIFQWDTLVLPEHRGHRLGLAVKVANLARAQAEHGERRVLHTWNAESNQHMLAVNEQLGFRPVERLEGWQLDL
jgi:GNAT superfamily N-acetyltransferase